MKRSQWWRKDLQSGIQTTTEAPAGPGSAGGLRIAHVIRGLCDPEALNGVETSLHGLANAQAKLGHLVRVLSVTRKLNKDIAPVTQLCVKPDLVRFWAPSLIRSLEVWRPDIIHLHSVFVLEHVAVAKVGPKRVACLM